MTYLSDATLKHNINQLGRGFQCYRSIGNRLYGVGSHDLLGRHLALKDSCQDKVSRVIELTFKTVIRMVEYDSVNPAVAYYLDRGDASNFRVKTFNAMTQQLEGLQKKGLLRLSEETISCFARMTLSYRLRQLPEDTIYQGEPGGNDRLRNWTNRRGQDFTVGQGHLQNTLKVRAFSVNTPPLSPRPR